MKLFKEAGKDDMPQRSGVDTAGLRSELIIAVYTYTAHVL